VDTLYGTAKDFAERHFFYALEAWVQVSATYSGLQIPAAVPVVGKIPGTLADLLEHPMSMLLTALESIAVHIAVLTFGHQCAMSTLFPLGLVLMLLPPLRRPGAFLASAALALWLVLPAVVVSLYIPVAKLADADQEPPLGLFITVAPFLSPSAVVAWPVLVPTLIGLWEEFASWYVRELLLWLYVPVLGALLTGLVTLALFIALGGGVVVLMLRRLLRWVLPIQVLRKP
jgi:hypothetical protein